MAGAAAALSNEHKPPTLDDYRGQGDKRHPGQDLANRTSRTALDKQRQANDPAAGDAETISTATAPRFWPTSKNAASLRRVHPGPSVPSFPKLPKNLTPEQRLVAERTQLETERQVFRISRRRCSAGRIATTSTASTRSWTIPSSIPKSGPVCSPRKDARHRPAEHHQRATSSSTTAGAIPSTARTRATPP